jgi:hypothetical protein
MPMQKLQIKAFPDEIFVTTGKLGQLIFRIANQSLIFLVDPKAIFAEFLA